MEWGSGRVCGSEGGRDAALGLESLRGARLGVERDSVEGSSLQLWIKERKQLDTSL